MGPSEIPKKIKKEIRSLAAKAHEEELRRALLLLADKFDQWKAGSRTSFELVEDIHKFHNGEAREIYKRYDHPTEEIAVAMALANGILNQDSASTEVLNALKQAIAFYQERK